MKFNKKTNKFEVQKTINEEIDLDHVLSQRRDTVGKIQANYDRLIEIQKQIDIAVASGFEDKETFAKDAGEILNKAKAIIEKEIN